MFRIALSIPYNMSMLTLNYSSLSSIYLFLSCIYLCIHSNHRTFLSYNRYFRNILTVEWLASMIDHSTYVCSTVQVLGYRRIILFGHELRIPFGLGITEQTIVHYFRTSRSDKLLAIIPYWVVTRSVNNGSTVQTFSYCALAITFSFMDRLLLTNSFKTIT